MLAGLIVSLSNASLAQQMSNADLSSELNTALEEHENSPDQLAQSLKFIYAKAILDNNLYIAEQALYLRALNLLYAQQFDEYQNWLAVYKSFYRQHNNAKTKFYIEKLELTRLFYQLDSLSLIQRGEALLQEYNVQDLSENTDQGELSIHITDIADVINFIGLAEQDMGSYASAIKRFTKALEIYESVGVKEKIAVVYGNIATVNAAIGDMDAAIEYNKRAIDINLEVESVYGYFQSMVNQASYLISKKIISSNNEQRNSYRNQAESILLDVKNDDRLEQYPRIKSDILYWLTYLYLDDGNLTLGESYLSDLYKSIEKRGEQGYLKQVKELEAYLLLEKGDFNKALDIYQNALSFYLDNKKYDKALVTLQDLIWATERQQDHEKSIVYLKQYVDLMGQVFNEKRAQVLAVEQEKNNAKLREHKIALLAEQNRSAELKIANRNLWLKMSSVIAVLIILIIWLRLRVKHKLSEQYQKMSYKDALTNVGNRLFFHEHIERELAKVLRARDRQSDQRLALIILDIDHFKAFNDQYGHDAGDRVLIEFAARLNSSIRETDLLARWGGEEFVIAGNVTNQQETSNYISRILTAINLKPFYIAGKKHSISCSIGAVAYPFFTEAEKEPKWTSLLTLADFALYRAKNAGRNRWCLFENTGIKQHDSLQAIIDQRVSVEQALLSKQITAIESE